MKTPAIHDRSTQQKKSLVQFPEHEKANVTRPCLVAACRGNENIADLLNYLIYEAEEVAKKTKVESEEITLQLSHEKMLKRNDGKNRFNFSERSLITYLRQLDTWRLVGIGKYGRSQTVRPAVINAAIVNPPEKPRRQKTGGRKRCKDESYQTASTFDPEKVELVKKVETLQEKVELLQLKVEKFQEFVEKFQLSQFANAALQGASDSKNSPLYTIDTIDSNRQSNTYGASANASAADEPTPLFPGKQSSEKKPERQRRGKNAPPAVVQPALPEPAPDPLTPEERRVFDLYCKLRFIVVPPKITPGRKEHCTKLAPFIHSQEDMEGLEKVARKQLKARGINVNVIELGNFVNALNEWQADQQNQDPPAAAPEPAPDPEKTMVLWRRVEHVVKGPAIKNWWLYEQMPLAEALTLGYNPRRDPPNAEKNTILNNLRLLAEGKIQLPPEARAQVA